MSQQQPGPYDQPAQNRPSAQQPPAAQQTGQRQFDQQQFDRQQVDQQQFDPGPYAGQNYAQPGPSGAPAGEHQQLAPQQQTPPPDDVPLIPGGEAPRIDVSERNAFAMNGFVAWLIIAALWVAAVITGAVTIIGEDGIPVPSVIMIILALIMQTSVTVVQPGQAKVLQFFGRYVGTVRRTGLVLTIPWTSKRNISTKIENFETNQLKVNDADGNPVNIAAIVVWQVADTAKASFSVEDYHRFVAIQAEAALRHVVPLRQRRGRRADPARIHRRGRRADGGGDERPRAPGRGGDHRDPDLHAGLRPRDRPGHAAAPAGQRDRRRPGEDPRRRGRHGQRGVAPTGVDGADG